MPSIPQPPPAMPVLQRPPQWERLLAGFVAAVGCLGVATAVWLDPYDSQGHPRLRGTHRQLGLGPCLMLSHVGFPCPSCGMTTSVSLLFHGDLPAACSANWVGVVVGSTGVAGTVWLGLLAAGLPRLRFLSAETTILAITLVCGASAAVRYVAMVAIALVA